MVAEALAVVQQTGRVFGRVAVVLRTTSPFGASPLPYPKHWTSICVPLPPAIYCSALIHARLPGMSTTTFLFSCRLQFHNVQRKFRDMIRTYTFCAAPLLKCLLFAAAARRPRQSRKPLTQSSIRSFGL